MKIGKGTRLLLLGVALVVIDQIIKVLVKTNMELGEQIMLIGQWCRQFIRRKCYRRLIGRQFQWWIRNKRWRF